MQVRKAADQKFWDQAFHNAYPECLKEMNLRGAEGCAQLAREQADAALAERRKSQTESNFKGAI